MALASVKLFHFLIASLSASLSHLKMLLNSILSGKIDHDVTSDCARLQQSFSQYLLYAVSNEKINTPKIILFP